MPPRLLPTTFPGWKHLLEHAATVSREESKSFRPEHFLLRSIATNEIFHATNSPLNPTAVGARKPDRTASTTKQAGPVVTPKESAVLVLLCPMTPSSSSSQADPLPCSDLACILTMRSSGLRSHARQMSFPGGRLDAGENAIDAAVRETWEEVGISRSQYDIIGPLSRIWSQPSKSWVTPVLAVSNEMLFPRIHSPNEVESLHYIHLAPLLEQSHFTHHRMNKHFSSAANWAISMPCFFASDELDRAVIEQPVPLPNVVPARQEDWGLTATRTDLCRGTLVWGLTAYILCDLMVRLAAVVNTDAYRQQLKVADDDEKGAKLTLPEMRFSHSQFVVRDPEVPDADGDVDETVNTSSKL